MTVKQLKNKLNKFDENLEIIVENDEDFYSGLYKATSVELYDNGLLLIGSDHNKKIED